MRIIFNDSDELELGLDSPFVYRVLEKFCNEAINKFIKGRTEHGGKITDRDCLKEMEDEIIDLMFYNVGAKEQKEQNQPRSPENWMYNDE